MTGTGVPSTTSRTASPLARAEHFLWLTARVLEQRRFAFHFLAGGADAVETALSAYRNDDGGYGHALEPDLRGPVSQPLHAAHALRVLDEIDRCGGQRAERLCRYLTAASTKEGALPAPHRPSAAGTAAGSPAGGYPTAPWVPVLADPPGDLPATGPVVGVLHRNGVWHAWLFRATDFCWAAVESLERPRPHEAQAAVAFLDAVPDQARAQIAADRLGRLVREQHLAVLEPERTREHPPGDHHFAYDFARSPGSLARRWFTDAEMERALDFLADGQEADGGWPDRGHDWAPGSRLERRPILTIEALLTLRAHGRPIA